MMVRLSNRLEAACTTDLSCTVQPLVQGAVGFDIKCMKPNRERHAWLAARHGNDYAYISNSTQQLSRDSVSTPPERSSAHQGSGC